MPPKPHAKAAAAAKKSQPLKKTTRNPTTVVSAAVVPPRAEVSGTIEGCEILPEACPKTKQHVDSYQSLQAARDAAAKDKARTYMKQITRTRMHAELQKRAGMTPRWYQIDCAEAAYLGLDTGLICSTGSGKTEAFMLILLADPSQTSKIIIVSPLSALEVDQVSIIRQVCENNYLQMIVCANVEGCTLPISRNHLRGSKCGHVFGCTSYGQ